MPRRARHHVPGLPYHLVQRGRRGEGDRARQKKGSRARINFSAPFSFSQRGLSWSSHEYLNRVF
jgi:hypothetical protein